MLSKDYLIAWGSGPGDDIKSYDVATYEDGMARLNKINEPRTVLSPDGTYHVKFPPTRWSGIMRNTPRNRQYLGLPS
jgi:hypothetical protein